RRPVLTRQRDSRTSVPHQGAPPFCCKARPRAIGSSRSDCRWCSWPSLGCCGSCSDRDGDMQKLDAQTHRGHESSVNGKTLARVDPMTTYGIPRCVGAPSLCIAALFLVLACQPSARPPVRPTAYNPAHDLGPLFHQIQMSGLFPDSKTFVDARPI